MEDMEDHVEGIGENQVNEEQSTFRFPIVNPNIQAQMKNISPSVLPHLYGKVHKDLESFLLKFYILCRSCDYLSDSQRLKLFPVTLKDATLCWFMGLHGNTINSWEKMKKVFLSKS